MSFRTSALHLSHKISFFPRGPFSYSTPFQSYLQLRTYSSFTRYVEPDHFEHLNPEEKISIIRGIQDRVIGSVTHKVQQTLKKPLPEDFNEAMDTLITTLKDPKIIEQWESEGYYGHKEQEVVDFLHSMEDVKKNLSKTSSRVPSWEELYESIKDDSILTQFFQEMETGKDPKDVAKIISDKDLVEDSKKGELLNKQIKHGKSKPVRLFGDKVKTVDYDKFPEKQDLTELLKSVQTPKGQLYFDRVKRLKAGEVPRSEEWWNEASLPETKHEFQSSAYEPYEERKIDIPWAKFSMSGKYQWVGGGIQVPVSDRSKHFSEGAGGRLDECWNKCDKGQGYFLTRMTDYEVINEIQQKSQSGFSTTSHLPYIIIGGKKGSGKSACISQTVLWARKSGFIVFWVPNAFEYVNSGYLEKSKVVPGSYEQPPVALKCLRGLMYAHKEQLKTLPLRSSFDFGPISSPTTKYNLYDLLYYASENEKIATEALFYFRNEMSFIHEFPTLIAVDGINCMWESSLWIDPLQLFKTMTPPALNPSQLVLSSLVRDYKHHGLVNGTFVGALTTSTPRYHKDYMENHGYEDVTHIVPRPSASEAHSIFNAYANRDCFPSINQGGNIAVFHALSQGNMHEMWEEMMSVVV